MSFASLPAVAFTILKIMVLLGLALYALFGAIMLRQEQLMDKVIDETFEPILHILVILHLAFAVGLFLLAIIIL